MIFQAGHGHSLANLMVSDIPVKAVLVNPIVWLAQLLVIVYCFVKFQRRQLMTKADIIETVSGTCGFSKKESSELVECVFSLIKGCLESGEDLKISGFGKFEVKQKNARRGRNPQTGEALEISARRILSFKPSQLLKAAISNA
jgi:integration host factor subunit alpha